MGKGEGGKRRGEERGEEKEEGLVTFGTVAGLVVLGEILEEGVFDPGHPDLVLLVVLLLCPLYVACHLCFGC